jgi:hypothetical protein
MKNSDLNRLLQDFNDSQLEIDQYLLIQQKSFRRKLKVAINIINSSVLYLDISHLFFSIIGMVVCSSLLFKLTSWVLGIINVMFR